MNRFISDIPAIANLKWTTPRKGKPIQVTQAIKVNNTTVALSTIGTLYVMSVDRIRDARAIDLNVRTAGRRSRWARRTWTGWVIDLLEAAVILGQLPPEALAEWKQKHKDVDDRNSRRYNAREAAKSVSELGLKVPAPLQRLADEPDEEVGE